MPSDETSIRLVTEQGLVEQFGYQIVKEEQKLRPETSTVSAFPVERHDNLRSQLPCHSHVGQAGVHRRDCILPSRRIETELNKRQKLVQRLVLWRPAGKAVRQVIRAVLKRQAPVKRFDGGNKDALSLTAGRTEAKCSCRRSER